MSLAEILSWQFDNAPGIRTREKLDGQGEPTGEMEIFDWPEALGPAPTAAQIAQWKGEFNALPPPPDPDTELAAAIGQARADYAAAADQAGRDAAFLNLCDALLGNAGKAGRAAGKPV